jgi:hypothetical protein
MLLHSPSLEVANVAVIRATHMELKVDHEAPTQSEATTKGGNGSDADQVVLFPLPFSYF